MSSRASQKKSGPAKKGRKAGGGLEDFQQAFFEQVPTADLHGWHESDKQAVAAEAYQMVLHRQPGTHSVRVENVERADGGAASLHTVIYIVNDDMPFIVDSISADLASRGLHIETLFHPVLRIARSGKGEFSGIAAADVKNAVVESHIFVRLEQIVPDADLKELSSALETVLADVRSATGDWQSMLKKMDAVIADVSAWAAADGSDEMEEAVAFLKYLRQNNFTFLGYRSYNVTTEGRKTSSAVVPRATLGVLKNHKNITFGRGKNLPEISALKAHSGAVMISKLIDATATVHRRVPLDAVSVKVVDKQGRLCGMHVFAGLFTSSTYSCRTSEVPIVRQKVKRTVAQAGFRHGSHDQKALEHILEKMPRDELFLINEEELYVLALGVLRQQEKNSVGLFVHEDPAKKYASCLLYVPRDRHNTGLRLQAGRILEEALGGHMVSSFSTLDDSPLARMLFTVRLGDAPAAYSVEEAEARISDLARDWGERLRHVLIAHHGKKEGNRLGGLYGKAFNSAYHDVMMVEKAVHDVTQIEHLVASDEDIRVDLYKLHDSGPGELRLKVYHKGAPASLSDVMPILLHMGLRGVSEMPFEVCPAGRDVIWIHDFHVHSDVAIELSDVKERFEAAFAEIWAGRAENDSLNILVLRAHLAWHEVRILRAYSGYLAQARFPFSRPYMEQALAAHPDIVRDIVDLFCIMHDPHVPHKDRSRREDVEARIEEDLQRVEKLDHDQILRGYLTLVQKTLRTNYFQRNADGVGRPCLAMKLDGKNIPFLPLPRPHVETYIYSARVEAVHLRGGEVARGGIRWSDRHDDFRTEVLGLMKAQLVKNTIIVPTGAKGGFVVKQPPRTGGRDAYLAEGVACYKIFIQALLDITDNIVQGKTVPPKDVVCHDKPDPYLVVAADKGTAKFSDIANGLSAEAGFWLGDAFASGGSVGYDHKGMGITARGAWECVKRHFCEMEHDMDNTPFTVIGVGDMGGDVFGNGMLLSKQIKMVAAFNHLHIFCDPDPDTEVSYAERKRLFKAGGGWDSYDESKLSKGGAVFSRSEKKLKLSPQIRASLGIEQAVMTPNELMRAILKAKVHLLWLGGIGTFVKSRHEGHDDADDRQNDNIRIDARDLRVDVVGEGANLGLTQRARVEYARYGGRINTDFIDNAGGVNCSDHEVNIKILLADVVGSRKITTAKRNALLEEMTDAVADLVLRDNYMQAQALTLQQYMAEDQIGQHGDMIRDLEKEGLIVRTLEGLPDEETLARLIKDKTPLTRPELCVLTAWARVTLYRDVIASDIPDAPELESLLFDYFPKPLHKYKKSIQEHKLRREIIATQIVSMLINRMGPIFVRSRMDKTGASAADVVRAFLITVAVYRLNETWAAIESLDGQVSSATQIMAHHEVYRVCKRAATWFLRARLLDISRETEDYGPGIAQMKEDIGSAISNSQRDVIVGDSGRMQAMGVPKALADSLSGMRVLSSASDIIALSRKTKVDVKSVALQYFRVGDALHFDWLRHQAGDIVPANRWEARVVGGLQDDYFSYQAFLTALLLRKKGKSATDAPITAWFGPRGKDMVSWYDESLQELRQMSHAELEMLVLARQWAGQLVDALK